MARVQGLEPKDPYKVWEVIALKKKDDATARKMLEQVTRQVQPVMRKHGWRVPLVTEFFPQNPALLGLNVNGGQVIKLRLRRAGDGSFLHYESVLGTMLHELCHNEHGPHNAAFYKLLDEITAECDDFMSRGIAGSGAGFDAASAGRLGGAGFGAHNPDPSQLRERMLKAAAARARTGALMTSGPRRLGGALVSLAPAQAAAAAAERRARDNEWCPCGDHAGGLSAEDAVIVENESTPAPARRGSAPAPAASQQPARAVGGAAGGAAGPPGDILDLTLSDDDDGAAPARGAAANGAGRAAPCAHGRQAGAAAAAQHATKRPRAGGLPGGGGGGDEKARGTAAAGVIRLDAFSDGGAGASDAARPGAADAAGAGSAWRSTSEARPWRCPACTLVNARAAALCAACAAPGPAPAAGAAPPGPAAEAGANSPPSGGSLAAPAAAPAAASGGPGPGPGQAGRAALGARAAGGAWACRFCTLQNAGGAERCGACDQWRYASGLPTPVLADNLVL